MSALLSIERDVHSRKHAKQPFDERYLELTSEPMHSRDGSERPDAPVISNLAREVKLRATLIQAQVHDLQRQVSIALSGKSKLSEKGPSSDGRCESNEGVNETPNCQVLSHEETAKNARILDGLKARDTATIVQLGESLVMTFAALPDIDDDSVMIQFLCDSENKVTKTSQNFAKSEVSNRVDDGVSNSAQPISAPVGFFAKYLKKVKPFSFEDTEQCDNDHQEVVGMIEDVVDEDAEYSTFNGSNADDWTINTENECAFAQEDEINQSLVDTSTPSLVSAAQPALQDADANNYQDDISDDDDAVDNTPTNSRSGLQERDHSQIQQKNLFGELRIKRDYHEFPDSLSHFSCADKIHGDKHISQVDYDTTTIYDESSTKDVVAFESHTGHKLTTHVISNESFGDIRECHNAKPSEVIGTVGTEAFNNDPFVTPQPPKKKKVSKHDKPETFFADYWGRFTVEDSTRYYQSLQAQCRNIRSTAKRRVRLKDRSSLLIEGAPFCGADARSILRSAKTKQVQGLLDFSDDSRSGESRIYLGSLDSLLHRNLARKSYAATLLSCTQHLQKVTTEASREENVSANANDTNNEDLGGEYDCSDTGDGITIDKDIVDATNESNALSRPNER
jgi:hypothetical protein